MAMKNATLIITGSSLLAVIVVLIGGFVWLDHRSEQRELAKARAEKEVALLAARIDLTQALVNSGINGALELYRTHMGWYPQEDDGGLMALVEEPEDDRERKNWRGPYVKSVENLVDAWGNKLNYECPGKYNERSYDLSSAGPDGVRNTRDDITN
ncbi:MAG: type II secretion system protein GspG [Planctomycetota bacterium]